MPAPSLSRTPGSVTSARAVQPGEHTVEILQSEMRFDSEQVNKLIKDGVVKQHTASRL